MTVNVRITEYPLILTVLFNETNTPQTIEKQIQVGNKTYDFVSAIYFASGHFTTRYYFLDKIWELDGMNKKYVQGLNYGCAEPIEVMKPFNEAIKGMLPQTSKYSERRVQNIFYLRTSTYRIIYFYLTYIYVYFKAFT